MPLLRKTLTIEACMDGPCTVPDKNLRDVWAAAELHRRAIPWLCAWARDGACAFYQNC